MNPFPSSIRTSVVDCGADLKALDQGVDTHIDQGVDTHIDQGWTHIDASVGRGVVGDTE